MLQGWGLAPGSAATQEAVAPPVPSALVAEVLDAEVPLAEGAGALGTEAPAESPLEGGGRDEESSEEEDSVDIAELQALLRDNAAFFEACEAAVQHAVGRPEHGEPQLQSAGDLRGALSHVCRRCRIEEVDEEEAGDLFDGPMYPGVFYQLAREYFSSLCRTLTMAV